MLKDRLAERLAGRGTAGGQVIPHLLVLIDNFPAFYASLQNSEGGQDLCDDLLEVMDIGRNAGISFVVSVERPDGLRGAVLALMHTRLALPLADQESYGALGLPRPKKSGEVVPGRALVAGHIIHEAQLADPRELLQSLHRDEALPGGPLQIAPLPEEVRYEALTESADHHRSGSLLMGLREGTQPLFWYPAGQHLVVLGPRRSGRSNTLAVALAEYKKQGANRFFVINPRRSRYLSDAAVKATAVYAERGDEMQAVWQAMETQISENFRLYDAGSDDAIKPIVIVIDDLDIIEIPSSTESVLQKAILRGSDANTTLLVSADTQALRSSHPSGVMRSLLSLRTGVLLNPSAPEDFDQLGVRGRPSRMPPGRGYFCGTGAKHPIQVALIQDGSG